MTAHRAFNKQSYRIEVHQRAPSTLDESAVFSATTPAAWPRRTASAILRRSGSVSTAVALLLALGIGCGDSDVAGAGSGSVGSGAAEPAGLLRSRFPLVASRVLGERISGPFIGTPDGFVPQPVLASPVEAAQAALLRRRGLHLLLPRSGGDVMRFSTAEGFAVEVREIGGRTVGRIEDGAVVYEHESGGGGSFWTVTEEGYEEWLLGAPPVAGAPVAEWEVRGGTLRQSGE
ncbi:MAG: hypothetical protein V2A73_07435, partial [Pseudomonadota bacterium]